MKAAGDWQRVQELFHAALEVPPEARREFVRQQADDAQVVQEVVSLLDAFPAAEGFLSGSVDTGRIVAALSGLCTGERVGPFEIMGLLGAGGMGEVYRARDTRLDREVAIKVLSPGFDADAAGRRRFEQEARAISKLTHPRISRLYDIGAATVRGAEVPYLVMELVDGETLAARLKHGRLPIEQALTIAIEIAEALAAAHAVGVVHRDIKPANIMLAAGGAKLLDFGLARLRPRLIIGESRAAESGDLRSAHTGIIGTLPYMAPEQLRGDDADARSDLFAFGAVLYEMLAGSRAFDAQSETDIVNAILEREPPSISSRQPRTSAALERLIATCLLKDPEERWQTSKDLVRELRWTRDDLARPASIAPVPRMTRTLGAFAAMTLLALTIIAVTGRPAPDPARLSFAVFAPDGTSFPRGTAEMAVSPDGSALVFVALAVDGTRHLWLRRFDTSESRLIEGSEAAHHPFWSPDGGAIGFFSHNQLKKIAATGGVPQVICELRLGARGGTWSRNGTILFSAFGQPLQRVSDAGGSSTPATSLDQSRDELTHAWPVFLPDGRRFLYLAQSNNSTLTAVFQGSLDSAQTRRVFAAESNVAVAGSSLLSLSKGMLTAQAYNPDRAQVFDSRITIAESITSDALLRSGGPFAAANGVIAYRSASPNSRLIWFNRNGTEIGAFRGPEADYHHPALSPDEKSIAIEKTDPATGRHTIWILDPSRGTSARLLLDPSGAHGPGWSPDGRRVVFSTNRHGGVDLYMIPSDGTGQAEAVLRSHELDGLAISDWSPDGRFLLYRISRRGQMDLSTLPLIVGGNPQPFLDSPASEHQGQFSPDVKWIAYTSDESGSPEVYVRRFGEPGAKRQVSTRGGAQARWRRDGRELFYLAPDGRLMAADVIASSDSIDIGAPRALFGTGITGGFVDRFNQYLVTRDGQRFLVNRSAEDENPAPITVVMNWDVRPAAR
jgi:Tol biopolymer transport system component